MTSPDRKALGAYYTPPWLADVLVDWAIESARTRILDPSFGGCAFLDSALRRLQRFDNAKAASQIYGIDIDVGAWQHAERLLCAGVPSSNLRRGSFFDPAVLDAVPTVDAVVGNPPYIRHHSLNENDIVQAQATVSGLGIHIPRLASAWAYFALISMFRVERGGRLALILPGALLHVNYAEAVLSVARTLFQSVRLIHVHDRLFPHTAEESVILLAAGRSLAAAADIGYVRVRGREEVARAVEDDKLAVISQRADYKHQLLGDEICNAFTRLAECTSSLSLGTYATIRIGVVTGANAFFVRPASDPIFNAADVSAVPIVSRNAWLNGPCLTGHALRRLTAKGERTQLAIIRGSGRQSSALRRELDDAVAAGISKRHHCSLRDPWYLIVDKKRPEMFLGYLNARPPTLVRNDARATCTNAIHRVNVMDRSLITDLITGSHSSLFALGCELQGRHYGGGVLKLEPTAAATIRIPLVTLDIGELMRCPASVRMEAVDAALVRQYRCNPNDIQLVMRGAKILKAQRERLRTRNQDDGGVTAPS